MVLGISPLHEIASTFDVKKKKKKSQKLKTNVKLEISQIFTENQKGCGLQHLAALTEAKGSINQKMEKVSDGDRWRERNIDRIK